MRAVVYDEFGGPEVLHVGEVPEPHAGDGEVRVRVVATSVNPYDAKVRRGEFASGDETFPLVPGIDASGVVDEVGPGVDDVAVGDLVFGSGSATSAEYAVLSRFWPVPPGVDATEATTLPIAETAARVLRILGLSEGDLLVLDGAAGGVGSAAVQLAVARGLRVVATASEGNQDYLRRLGATPTTYGPGLAARVNALVDAPVAGAADLAGRGGLAELVELTGDPSRVVTIADFSGSVPGVHVTSGGPDGAWDTLPEVAELAAHGRYVVELAASFPWDRAAEAHTLSETGHVRGKIILSAG